MKGRRFCKGINGIFRCNKRPTVSKYRPGEAVCLECQQKCLKCYQLCRYVNHRPKCRSCIENAKKRFREKVASYECYSKRNENSSLGMLEKALFTMHRQGSRIKEIKGLLEDTEC